MEQLVVQRVGEGGRRVLVDGHRAVVGEVGVVHHGVHVVAPNGKERSSHSPGTRVRYVSNNQKSAKMQMHKQISLGI